MEQQSHREEALVDAKVAEETLKLAARLQANEADKIPVSALHQIALEAGIESRHVNAALKQVQAESVEIQPKGMAKQKWVWAERIGLLALFLGLFLALGFRQEQFLNLLFISSPIWIVAIVLRLTRRRN